MSIYVDQFALNTSTGLQAFTMPKITDSVNVIGAMCFITPPANDSISSNSCFSIGYADGSNQSYTTISSQNGASNTDRRSNTNALIVTHAANGAIDASLAFSSFGAKALTVNITDAPVAASIITVVLFTDESFTGASVFNQSLGTGTTDLSVVTTGVDPDLIFASSIGANTASTSTANAIFSIGAAADNGTSIENALVAYWDENGQTPADSGGLSSSDAIASQTFNGANSWNAAVTSMGTGQFDIKPDASAGNDFIFGIALQKTAEASVNIVASSLPASTGNQAFSGFGFSPESVLSISTSATSEDTVQGGACSFAVCGIDSSATNTAATSSEDAANPQNTNSLNSTDFSLLAADGARSHQATLDSFDADGITLNFTTATAANRSYFVGVTAGGSAQIDSVDGDDSVTDGQGAATVEVSGFGSAINSITVTDSTYTTSNIFISDDDWAVPDLLNLVSDTASGQPNWLAGSLELTAGDGVDSASRAFSYVQQAGTDVVTVLNATNGPGSVFEGLPSAPDDGSVIYYSTSGNTAIAPDGMYESDLQQFNITLWHIDTGVYDVGTIDNSPAYGGFWLGAGISLGIGLALAHQQPSLSAGSGGGGEFIDGFDEEFT